MQWLGYILHMGTQRPLERKVYPAHTPGTEITGGLGAKCGRCDNQDYVGKDQKYIIVDLRFGHLSTEQVFDGRGG